MDGDDKPKQLETKTKRNEGAESSEAKAKRKERRAGGKACRREGEMERGALRGAKDRQERGDTYLYCVVFSFLHIATTIGE